MNDKENKVTTSSKRRISVLEDDMIVSKRQLIESNDFDDESECDRENDSKYPTAVASTCLTDSFNIRCKLKKNEKSCEIPICYRTPEDQTLSLEQFKKLPKPRIDCVEVENVSLITESKSDNDTPEEQILPLSQFKNLPKPSLSSSDVKIGKCVLNKSISDVSTLQTSVMLDDSFELVKHSISKQQSLTPLNTQFNPSFLTPETPCDINDIDLDKQTIIVNHLPNLNRPINIKRRKHLEEMYNVSPMCYENRSTKKDDKRMFDEKLAQRTMFLDEQEIDRRDLRLDTLEHNRIEEISAERVGQIIDNDYIVEYDDGIYAHHIVDCRYPYEYEGGHIIGAVNLHTPFQMLNYIFLSNFDEQMLRKPVQDAKQELANLLVKIKRLKKLSWKNKAFVFHCEFSSIRGPEMASLMRNVDRFININIYPGLYFPKVFIMKMGYKDFYKKCKRHCMPQMYVRMNIIDPSKCGQTGDNELDDSIEDSDNEETVDKDTIECRIREYNDCKSETQDQVKVLKQLMKDFDSNK